MEKMFRDSEAMGFFPGGKSSPALLLVFFFGGLTKHVIIYSEKLVVILY